jgi:phenylacetate-CoA ligase
MMSQTPTDFIDLEQNGSPSPDIQHDHFTRQQLERYQARALQLCREYAYAHSPFYQQLHRGLTDRPLHELPVLTKSMLMEHFDEFMTDRAIRLEDVKRYMADPDRAEYYLDRYRVMTTSGSTGTPAIFVYNHKEWGTVMGALGRVISWLGPSAQGRPCVISSTSSFHMSAYIQKSMAQRNPGGLRVSANDPLEATVQRLNEWQPTAILGYPSLIRVFADEQAKGRLHIAPRATACVSEYMSEGTRRRIKGAWNIQPHNLYAVTEGGILGVECENHLGLHIFEDLVILESVDHNNQPVPPGTFGEKVLVTALFSRTMPLIRYELTDSVCVSVRNACPCGRPYALIEAPRGRIWGEALYFPSETGTEVAVHPVTFEGVIDMFPISGWKVIQEHDGVHVLISGSRPEEIDEALLKTLRQALAEHKVKMPSFYIEHVDAIPRSPTSGKVTLVSSRISRPTN